MNWLQAAALLAERSESPLVLLDEHGKVRLLNAAMAAVLGRPQEQVVGLSWASACGRTEAVAVGHEPGSALSTAETLFECDAISREGRRLFLSFRANRSSCGRWLLLELLHVRAMNPRESSSGEAQRAYEISADQADFGIFHALSEEGVARDVPEGRGRCFEVLQGRKTPCPDCPALRPTTEPWPRTYARQRRPGVFEVVTAELVSQKRVRLLIRSIAADVLTAIHDAKLQAVAERAGLSERERAVLRYLLIGRTLEDIATILDIGTRTVKFHQSNILAKLGADSRVDLVRFIL